MDYREREREKVLRKSEKRKLRGKRRYEWERQERKIKDEREIESEILKVWEREEKKYKVIMKK